ncbi:MAG: hypothetical protein KAU60_09550, partial [Desulfobacterales bacterium]|nr:hypothetical protein [Desulfobacterales bacterium]
QKQAKTGAEDGNLLWERHFNPQITQISQILVSYWVKFTVINLGDFIINHHEEHEGFFLYLRSLRALRGKNIVVCASEFS